MPDKLYHESLELISQGRVVLEDLQVWGFETVSSAREADLPICSLSPVTSAGPAQACRAETLEELGARLQDCQLCPLCQKRQKVVFGVGNPQADLMLVGEVPGQEEDEAGTPFTGEVGQLLDRILFAMRLQRQDVYLCHLVKCRPTNNRDPQPQEVATCEQFLKLQIAAIQPRVIVTLGRFAAQSLLQSQDAIADLRGHWREYQGIALMPTYHPAYLLQTPAGKRDVWQDMKQVMHKLQA